MHEMPDLFRMGDYWYLLTTEYSDKSKTVYRMSKTLNGPWTAPVDDAFDGRAYYAARSYSDGDKRYLFGWVPTKENENDLDKWQWGGALVVHEVYPREDGSLGVKIPDGVYHAFREEESLIREPLRLSAGGALAETYLAKETGDLFKFEAKVSFSETTRSFGIRLFDDEATGDAYEFLFHVGENRLSFDRRPNLPWNRYDNKGLERPIAFEANKEYTLRVIVDDTIATVYIDGVALNARMYATPGTSLAMYVVDGELDIKSAALAKGLKDSDSL
jgi:beta-fructofuranosidase